MSGMEKLKNLINCCSTAEELEAVTIDYCFEDGMLYHRLAEMPFDKDGRHATGWEFWDGERWWDEYEES